MIITNMDIETQVAVQFVVSFLSGNFSQELVDKYGKILLKLLVEKFQDHWYPENPAKGSAYRCVTIEKHIDVVLAKATLEADIDAELLQQSLPKRLDLWIDPSEVSYRIGLYNKLLFRVTSVALFLILF